MNEVLKNYIVPLWISSRVYECSVDGEDVCRTYILNSKTHEYMTFEGNAAKLWSFVLNNDYNGLISYAKENDLYDELNLFFEELRRQNLVIIKRHEDTLDEDKVTHNSVQPFEAKNFLEEMSSWIYKNGFLPSLFIEMTHKCNLKCIHCYNDEETRSNIKELSFAEIKPIIDDAYKLGVFNITLSGGECTLTKDFVQIAKYIKSKKLSLDIFTNGQSLYDNYDLYKELLSLFPSRVYISLYSMKPEIHDKITRVQGSHKKTLSIIKKLKKDNLFVGINCFFTKYNYNSYEEIKKFSTKYNISVTYDMTLFLNKTKDNQFVSLSEKQIYEMYSLCDGIFLGPNYSPNKNNTKYSDDIICKGGHYFFCVSPSLELYPCVSLRHKLGDLNKNSFPYIINKSSKLKKFRAIRRKDISECYNEKYCGHCNYCMGHANTENKFLKKSKTCCTHAKAKWKVFEEKINI